MYSVRVIFSEDKLDVAVENFNTYPDALSYQIEYAKKHKDSSNIRTVYVKKINLDDCTHLVYCSESASTYFMGTKQECELYRLHNDLNQEGLRVEVAQF
jgi:hypothetical protein